MTTSNASDEQELREIYAAMRHAAGSNRPAQYARLKEQAAQLRRKIAASR